jgi:hypothetical protein
MFLPLCIVALTIVGNERNCFATARERQDMKRVRVPAAHDDMLRALPECTMRLRFFKPGRSVGLS